MNVRPSITRISQWLDQLQPNESAVLGATAVVVGLLSGVGVWAFKELIELVHLIAFDGIGHELGHIGGWTVALLPVLGGLVVGFIMHYIVGTERRHGVSGIMEAVALAGGRLRYWRIPSKVAAAAISIGAGASVGPEDPSVQLGAGIGSMFGQMLRLSDKRIRAMVAAGAAGGIAAAFNAPIAGVFFALEIILGELAGSSFGIVVIAAVVSAVFTQAVSGIQPAFHIPAYAFHSAWELPFYIVLGLLAGPVAAYYSRLVYAMQDFFRGLELPRWAKPAAAGLTVGIVGIFLPQIFGVGYETIDKILNDAQLAVWLLLVLLVAKLVLTTISIGGGFPGGVFAPSLFLGATLGAAVGSIAEHLFPNLGIAPPAFALVGMAAVLAGTVHAPLTAIILLFEMTNDYRIILPLMFAVAISLLISQRMRRESIYTYALARKGIRIERGRDVEVLEALTVGEVMQHDPPTLRESDTVVAAAEILMRLRRHGLPVVNKAGELVGIVTVQDIDRTHANGEVTTVGEICTQDLLVAHPDETLGTALRRMSVRDIGRLPVVDRYDDRKLIGILRRSDVIRAYDTALTRRVSSRHRAQQSRLDMLSGVTVEEVVVQPGAQCVGRRIRDVQWPPNSVIATLRRRRHVHIPRGDTVIHAGDVLAVVAEQETHVLIREICGVVETQG